MLLVLLSAALLFRCFRNVGKLCFSYTDCKNGHANGSAFFFLLRIGVSDVHKTFVQVCADHFDASCIEKTTSYTDPKTGRVIEVALLVPRLRPGSVPTVFPGCPSYLSVRDQSTRETPDAKRSRQEASQLARAVEESLASYEAEQERDRFSSLEELRLACKGCQCLRS
ncbi:hypothetical protein HPB48_022516 [Haemaphysalis longicornis]|uniref:Secreted protein n=1 Tax=Haemaphysalis longicornis TaxID=44386 RepID=A0A9J6FB64_HAELO|nr:hypothetical protein HPB48_022516 [Haemaphysalis longicornis]